MIVEMPKLQPADQHLVDPSIRPHHQYIFEDQDFIDKELEQFAVTSRAKYIKDNFQQPWMDRVGMTDFFKKKGLR